MSASNAEKRARAEQLARRDALGWSDPVMTVAELMGMLRTCNPEALVYIELPGISTDGTEHDTPEGANSIREDGNDTVTIGWNLE